jgi:hypothetical protein
VLIGGIIALHLAVHADGAQQAASPAGPPSNLQFVEECMRTAAGDLVDHMPPQNSLLPANALVSLTPLAGGEANWMAEQALVENLRRRGVRVVVMEPAVDTVHMVTAPADTTGRDSTARAARATDPNGRHYLFEYRVSELTLTYPKVWRGLGFSVSRVQRSARAALAGRLRRVDDGEIVWTGDGSGTRSDVVNAKNVRMISSTTLPVQTQPVVPSARWSRFLEPVLVAAIIASLVSLFYTNR